jgi:2-polyprenyl-3-methyl-5-hydroxy-6-metoxy-1,4-benzoquinol methylase
MPEAREWNSVWNGMKGLEFGEEPYMWKFYESLIGEDYDFRGKRVIELGCGTGINTILMARRGAKVTFLDFSREALDLVRKNMEAAGVDGEFILGDMLDYDFDGEFDISHSEGVVEHFRGPQRQGVIDRHADALKRGGRTVIIVPQVGSLMYRTGKFLAEVTRTWIHGGEYPYTRNELFGRMERADMAVKALRGGELLMAFGWLFSPLWLRDGTVLERSIKRPWNRTFFRLNYNNWFADRYGRVLGGVGIKK